MTEQDYGAHRGVPAELESALAAEVSLRSRMRYVAVGLAGGCAALLIALMWATEPQPLPARTQAAFAGLIAAGPAWATVAGWAVSRRRPRYAQDQVLTSCRQAREQLNADLALARPRQRQRPTRGKTAHPGAASLLHLAA
ncbi:hypothetical protein [Streptomyces cupreus]|uniref:hypothetical protein n=1 Tax=Streptomyces cupreus TaxID=2759956 RepID=UPI001C922E66|nr:hypothetical protein [Streptomyces cupreus]